MGSAPVPAECQAQIWCYQSPGAPLCAQLGSRGAGNCSHPDSAEHSSGQTPWEPQNIPVFISRNAWLKKAPSCFPWQGFGGCPSPSPAAGDCASRVPAFPVLPFPAEGIFGSTDVQGNLKNECLNAQINCREFQSPSFPFSGGF